MATYKIGQRVRIVCHEWLGEGPSPRGSEGVIRGYESLGNNTGKLHEYSVELSDGRMVVADSYELEPIIPDGMQPSVWEKCEWQPDHTLEHV